MSALKVVTHRTQMWCWSWNEEKATQQLLALQLTHLSQWKQTH